MKARARARDHAKIRVGNWIRSKRVLGLRLGLGSGLGLVGLGLGLCESNTRVIRADFTDPGSVEKRAHRTFLDLLYRT